MQQHRINNKTNLIQPTNAFKARPDKGSPGGSSISQYMDSTQDKSSWIGKCSLMSVLGKQHNPNETDPYEKERTQFFEEYREYLGIRFYQHFGVIVPDTVLSLQPLSTNHQNLYGTNKPCLHLMSKFVMGYKDMGETFQNDYIKQSKTHPHYTLGGKYPLKGLGRVLAVANFILDMDCLGKSGGNMGYVINMDDHNKPYAQAVKIDPGFAFMFMEGEFYQAPTCDPRTRSMWVQPEMKSFEPLGFNQLSKTDQAEYIATAQAILKTPKKTLYALLAPGIGPNKGFTQRYAEHLMKRLLERKAQFMSAFSLEISDELREEITNAQSKQFTQYFKSSVPLKRSKEEKKARLELQKANLELAKSRFQFNPNLHNKNPVKGFQLPSVDTDFFGRAKVMKTIRDAFKNNQGIVYQGIQGLGGLGKTTLARRYAEFALTQNDFLKGISYQAVIWLHVEQGLSDQFRTLAEVYKIRATKLNEMVTGVYRVLAQKRVLIVFDNVNTEKDLKNFLPPKGNYTGLHILITTRNTELSLNLREEPSSSWLSLNNLFTKTNPKALISKPITLMRFTPKEGRDYLKNQLENPDGEEKTDPIDPKLYDAVVEAVYGIPLALTQASAYIQQGHGRLQDYPRLFAQSRLQQGVHDHQSPVLMTFLMAWFELRSTHPLAEPLLVACSYTAPDDIPLTYLRQLPHLKNASDNDLLATLIPLYQHSLLSGNVPKTLPKTLSLHRLTQDSVRAWDVHKKDRPLKTITAWKAMIDPVLDFDEKDLTTFYAGTPLIPHAIELVAWGERFGMKKPDCANGYFSIARQQQYLGNYTRAKDFYEKALRIKTKHFGKDHVQTANTLMGLGIVYWQLGDLNQAKDLYEKALRIQTKHFGKDHVQTAMTLMNLGIVYHELSDLKQAKELYEKALRIQTKHFGQDHVETAATLINLGLVYHDLGDLKQAKDLYEKALRIQNKHFGQDHVQTAMTIINLGNVYHDLGDLNQAKDLYEKGLRIKTKHFGQDHVQTAMTIMNLGVLHQQRGDKTQARHYYEKALRICKTMPKRFVSQIKCMESQLSLLKKPSSSSLPKPSKQEVKENSSYITYLASWVSSSLGSFFWGNETSDNQPKSPTKKTSSLRLQNDRESKEVESNTPPPPNSTRLPQTDIKSTSDKPKLDSSSAPSPVLQTSPKIDEPQIPAFEALFQNVSEVLVKLEKKLTTLTPPNDQGPWDPFAAGGFLAVILRMIRKDRYTALRANPEGYGIPKKVMAVCRDLVAQHSALELAKTYPDRCRNELENKLLTASSTSPPKLSNSAVKTRLIVTWLRDFYRSLAQQDKSAWSPDFFASTQRRITDDTLPTLSGVFKQARIKHVQNITEKNAETLLNGLVPLLQKGMTSQHTAFCTRWHRKAALIEASIPLKTVQLKYGLQPSSSSTQPTQPKTHLKHTPLKVNPTSSVDEEKRSDVTPLSSNDLNRPKNTKSKSPTTPPYILLDHGGVLNGDMVLATDVTKNDLVLYKNVLPGYHQVLKDGIPIMKRLHQLVALGYRLGFHSKNVKANQIKLLQTLIDACKQQTRGKVQLPPIELMMACDAKAYPNHSPDKPKQETVTLNGYGTVHVLGYGHDRDGKACVRAAFSSHLSLDPKDRHRHSIVDDGPSVIRAAKKEGYRSYRIGSRLNDLKGWTLLQALDDLYKNGPHQRPPLHNDDNTTIIHKENNRCNNPV